MSIDNNPLVKLFRAAWNAKHQTVTEMIRSRCVKNVNQHLSEEVLAQLPLEERDAFRGKTALQVAKEGCPQNHQSKYRRFDGPETTMHEEHGFTTCEVLTKHGGTFFAAPLF